MNVCVLAKDELEAKGIEWMIQSHMPAVSVHAVENEAALKKQIQEVRPAFVVLDMDRASSDELEKWLAAQAIRWVGLSSERMFQTAYRALKGKAEDVLFRPFSPMDLIRHLQQVKKKTASCRHLWRSTTVRLRWLLKQGSRVKSIQYCLQWRSAN